MEQTSFAQFRGLLKLIRCPVGMFLCFLSAVSVSVDVFSFNLFDSLLSNQDAHSDHLSVSSLVVGDPECSSLLHEAECSESECSVVFPQKNGLADPPGPCRSPRHSSVHSRVSSPPVSCSCRKPSSLLPGKHNLSSGQRKHSPFKIQFLQLDTVNFSGSFESYSD